MAIFKDDVDHEVFLAMTRQVSRAHDLPVHTFVLMKNHYHLLVTPTGFRALGRAIKRLSEKYVKYFNRKHDRSGTLWSGRYRPFPITDEAYLLNCLRYIEQNPVRAELVSRPGDYPWSSYGFHALGQPSDWLTAHHVYQALGPTPLDRQLAYRCLCEVPLGLPELVAQRLGEGAKTGADSRTASVVASAR
jgi:putative transposase